MPKKYVVNTNYAKDQEKESTKPASNMLAITVHKNGEIFNIGKKIVINPRQIRTWEALLENIRKTFDSQCKAIRAIVTPTNGTRVSDFADLDKNRRYVAIPAGEKLKRLDYNTIDDEILHPKPTLTKEILFRRLKKRHRRELAHKEGRINDEMGKRGKTIYIYRNGDEFTRAIHIYLTPVQMQELELILRTIGEKVVLQDNRAIRRLFNMDGKPVQDAAGVMDGESYVAAGGESMHHCQYGHALPRLQVGTARKKGKHVGVHYLHELPDELHQNLCSLTGHSPRSFRSDPPPLPPLNSCRELESQRRNLTYQESSVRSDLLTYRPLPDIGKTMTELKRLHVHCCESGVDEAAAATKIQAGYRGFCVRKERRQKEQAARKIQAGFRSYRVRKELHQGVERSPSPASETVCARIPSLNDSDARQHQAASRIQAGFRGYRTRKQLLRTRNSRHSSIPEEAVIPALQSVGVDPDRAATRIQAGFRGYRTRKQYHRMKEQRNPNASNDLMKRQSAATRIQASFRGYRVRKDLRKERGPDTIQDN